MSKVGTKKKNENRWAEFLADLDIDFKWSETLKNVFTMFD